MKSVFGFCVRLGNPDLDFENLNPDFPIERTLSHLDFPYRVLVLVLVLETSKHSATDLLKQKETV